MDLSILIRTLVVEGSTLSYNVGGAVVLGSDPISEYQETLDKGVGMRLALTAYLTKMGKRVK